jgi:hypothetical protein
VSEIDLRDFFVPPGRYSVPVGVTYSNGEEAIYQVEHDAVTGKFYQNKGHINVGCEFQEHGYDADWIYLFYDNSSKDGIPFALRDDLSRRGSRWVERRMRAGQVSHRSTYVLKIDPNTGETISIEGPVVSYMKLAAVHENWRSDFGVVVDKVAVLEWYLDAALTQRAEVYKIGWSKQHGGLGFIEYGDGDLTTRLNGIWPAAPPAEHVPVLERKPNPVDKVKIVVTPTTPVNVPTPPTTTLTPGDKGSGRQGTLYTGDYVNLRPAPSTIAEPAVRILNGTAVTWYPGTERSNGGWQWVWVDTAGRSGWMARVFPSWATQFAPLTPDVTPAPAAMLDIPWVSQLGTDAPDANDCGPAAGTSALRAIGRMLDKKNLQRVTPQQFNAKLGSKQTGANIGDMVNVFASYEVTARAFRATLENIRRELTLGNYPIVVIQRGQIPALMRYNAFADAHWIGVRGYDASRFVVVDALVGGGNNIIVSATDLGAALAGSKWNGVQQSGYLGVVVDMPKPPKEEPTKPSAPETAPVQQPVPVPPDLYAAVMTIIAKQEQADAKFAEAYQAYLLTSAENLETLKGVIGYQ